VRIRGGVIGRELSGGCSGIGESFFLFSDKELWVLQWQERRGTPGL
jgi:hypothetical protein